jgi:mono/diheme cytochrome c family protein
MMNLPLCQKRQRLARVLLLISALFGAAHSATAQSLLPADPMCSTFNRFNIVLAGRTEAIRQHQMAGHRSSSSLSALALQRPNLTLVWDHQNGAPQLSMRSEIGAMLQLETSSSLAAPSWEPLLGVQMNQADYQWLDSSSVSGGTRFYRVARLENAPVVDPVDDFLLLDQDGKAHELFYHTELDGIVVMAAGDSSGNLPALLSRVQSSLSIAPTNRVAFWILLSDPAATRASVSAQLKAANLTVPVLFDPLSLGAGALHIHRAGETVLIQPTIEGSRVFNAFYRGQLPLGATASPEEGYFRTALQSLLQNSSMTFFRRPLDGPALAADSTPTPNYAHDVAPIFQQYCQKCHRPNDVAPFALTNYDAALSWAPVMKHALLSNEMPPWHTDPQSDHFTNSLALPVSARATLVRWIDAGAPRGAGPDPLAQDPLPPSYRQWPADLGQPDAIVMPLLQSVRATGIEAYRYIFVQTPNPTSVWLRAAIILPSNPAVVHHYLVWNGKVGNTSPIPGFSTYQSSLAGYAPGMAPYRYPDDSGYPLTASNWITFNLHYTPNGEATTDQPTLALWYHKSKPPKTYHQDSIDNLFFSIPPRTPEFQTQAEWTVSSAVRIHRLNPHMHLRGKYAGFTAFYPDGTSETLLSVPDYSFLWQNGYDLAQPKTLPAGTRVVFSGAFDNSPQNLNNPDPTATVYWGDQTSSEMFAGFIDYVE